MAKTARDARRHIKIWSNFFAEAHFVTREGIEKFLETQKKRKYLKQSLRRLQERGFLLQKGHELVPTREGLRFFHKQKMIMKKNDLKFLGRDTKWRLISFDVPVSLKQKRESLRGLLREFDFYQLHKSVWICPNKLAEEFWQLLSDYDLQKYCKAMVVDVIEGDEGARKHFQL